MNITAQAQAQTQAFTLLSEKQVRRYFSFAKHVWNAGGIFIIGVLAFIAGLLLTLNWLLIGGIIIAIASVGYWYYLYKQTPSDERFDQHMDLLRTAVYYQALSALNIHRHNHLDPLIIQSFIMPGMSQARTYNRENLRFKECDGHLRSSFCKYTFIFANTNFIGIYEGYVDAFDGSTFVGETPRQYRLNSIVSIEAVHNTTDITIRLGETSYRYQQEAMALELTNGRPISLTVFASPVNHDLPTFFATSRADAYQVYNMITHWWQQ